MRRLLIASTVLALALVGPASAQAATLTLDRPCFASVPGSGTDQPITFTITGGTPGFNWQVGTADFRISGARGVFDGSGTARGVIPQYSLNPSTIDPSRGQTQILQVKEGPNLFGQAVTGQAPVTITNAALKISRSGRSAFRKRSWTMSGVNTLYGGSSTLYASWVKGTRGKRVVKRSRLGRAKGACGYLATKRVLPPARRAGSWTLYVHSGKKLNKSKAIAYPFRVFVF